MEIEVGEYIRTKKGLIGMVIKIREGKCINKYRNYLIDWGNGKATYRTAIKDIKHSKNIKDLIEADDYVNGYKVELSRYNELYYAYVYCGGIGVRTIEPYATFIKDMKNEDIESVVTKELFEQHSYKL